MMMLRWITMVVSTWMLLGFVVQSPVQAQTPPPAIHEADVVIYGGTSAAITTAVATKQAGKSVVVVCPDKHLGGLSSGGLGWTDTGNKDVIGGLAKEFYHRVYLHYQTPEAWDWQTQASYGNQGQGNAAMDISQRTMWIFEPHVAESIFDAWVKDLQIPVYRERWLNREAGVEVEAGRIKAITMLDGSRFSGKMFVDATYEGDLMAAAGASYHVGRESNETYGEKWNGVQVGVLHHRHHFGIFKQGISPYVVPGQPSSGLLPRVSAEPPGEYGAADKRIQAYCFRMCLTNHEPNRLPFPKPAGYDPKQYELLKRVLEAGWREAFEKFDPIPNRKTDTNNHGPFSTDNIGFNYDYPEASYQRRREIIEEHRQYQQGLMYFLANDPDIPADVREKLSKWGLAKDEFVDNGNWPHQIYVREARRLIGSYVMTENELLKKRPTPDSIGMGSYTMDSHNVQRYVTPEGFVQNEGDIGVSTSGPYQIALGSILPKREQLQNLLVPVCVSSSHIAYGSIRMEPVFMILGESAATVAALAIDANQPVQDVPYAAVRERLLKQGQVLEYQSLNGKGIDPKKLPGIVVDDEAAKQSGNWTPSHSAESWIGSHYLHDGDEKDAVSTMRFETKIPATGLYQVSVAYPPNANRASNALVKVQHGGDTESIKLDQRKSPGANGLKVLGTYHYEEGEVASVTISNEGTDGYVIADAVQWLGIQE